MRVVIGAAIVLAAFGLGSPASAQQGGGGSPPVTGVGDASTANQPSTIGLGSVSSPGFYGYGDEPDYSRIPRFHGRSIYGGPPRHLPY